MPYSKTILNKLYNLCHTHTDKTAQRHAAAVYSSKNKVLGEGINRADRGRCYGCSSLTSLHAEANAIHRAYGSLLTQGVLKNWLSQLKVARPYQPS